MLQPPPKDGSIVANNGLRGATTTGQQRDRHQGIYDNLMVQRQHHAQEGC